MSDPMPEHMCMCVARQMSQTMKRRNLREYLELYKKFNTHLSGKHNGSTADVAAILR